MSLYETIFICPAELPQEKIEATLEKVKTVISRGEGKVNTAELWGRRRLSYPIKRSREGFYVYVTFSAPRGLPAALDHHYRVTDTILRGLTVKVDERYLQKMKSPLAMAAPAPAPAAMAVPPAEGAVPSPAAPAAAAPVAPAPQESAPAKG